MTQNTLWYKLLTAGKRELGWEYGLSIPFLVGVYSQKREKDYGSLAGLKEIFDEIKATIGDEEIGIVKCGEYTTMDVYMVQVLSDIPSAQARVTRENPVFESKIYTTIQGVSSLDSLVEKLWEMYEEPIMKGDFSAHKSPEKEEWRIFNTDENKMISNL